MIRKKKKKHVWTTVQTVRRQTGTGKGDSENKGAVWSVCYRGRFTAPLNEISGLLSETEDTPWLQNACPESLSFGRPFENGKEDEFP